MDVGFHSDMNIYLPSMYVDGDLASLAVFSLTIAVQTQCVHVQVDQLLKGGDSCSLWIFCLSTYQTGNQRGCQLLPVPSDWRGEHGLLQAQTADCIASQTIPTCLKTV